MTTVSVVHCETSSGVVNPIERIGEAVKTYDTSIPEISHTVLKLNLVLMSCVLWQTSTTAWMR